MTHYYFYKFSTIKWYMIKDFFHSENVTIHHIFSLDNALEEGLNIKSEVFFWGKKVDEKLLEYTFSHSIKTNYVEDGFIRSLGLGSSLSRPLSIVCDSRGIYFDPMQKSDLEHLLSTCAFDEALLKHAKDLMKMIRKLKISKYNSQDDVKVKLYAKPGQKIVLIPGQVDDDMSVKFGAPDMSNMLLIEKVRKKRPNDYLVYKPHPDVLSGNRDGMLDEEEILKYADQMVINVSIDMMISLSDEVHTMTSLSGFDALVREKPVYTYGMPFYAGWGLTIDEKKCERRKRELTLEELAAAAFILYPKYLNPYTKKLTDPDNVVQILEEYKNSYKKNLLFKYSTVTLGYVLPRIRRFIKFTIKNLSNFYIHERQN